MRGWTCLNGLVKQWVYVNGCTCEKERERDKVRLRERETRVGVPTIKFCQVNFEHEMARRQSSASLTGRSIRSGVGQVCKRPLSRRTKQTV